MTKRHVARPNPASQSYSLSWSLMNIQNPLLGVTAVLGNKLLLL